MRETHFPSACVWNPIDPTGDCLVKTMEMITRPDHAAASRRGPSIDNPSAYMLLLGNIGFLGCSSTSTFTWRQWVHREELFWLQWLPFHTPAVFFFFFFLPIPAFDGGSSFLITAGLPSALFLFLGETKKIPSKWFRQKRAKLSVNGSLDAGIECCCECNVTIDHLEEMNTRSLSTPARFCPFNRLSHNSNIAPVGFFFLFNSPRSTSQCS